MRRVPVYRRLVRALRLLFRSSRALAVIHNLAIKRVPSRRFWTWEVYGLGCSTKDLLDLPQSQELRCSSDHGVHLATEPSPEEIALGSDLFVTWSPWRANLKFPDGRMVVQVKHPWISYSRKHKLRKRPGQNSKGTLAFVPHSVPELASDSFSLSDYVRELSSLPAEFQPVTLCFHAHDINFRQVMEVLRMQVNVETVGASLSPVYTRRFYKIIRPFKFATSPTVGSQLFYCHEYGLDYFLFDPQKKFQRKLIDHQGPKPNPDLQRQLEKLFTMEGVAENKEEKDDIVSRALGLKLADPEYSGIKKIFLQHGVVGSFGKGV